MVLAGAFSFAAPPALLVVLGWAFATLYPANLPNGASSSYAALALAFLGLAATVPTLVAMVFAGVLADRFRRRRLMLTVNAASILATIGIGALAVVHPEGTVGLPGPPGFYLPLWAVLVLPLWSAVIVCATLFRPAFNAAVPRVVSTADLGSTNALVYLIALIVSLPGDLLTPTLYQTWGPAWAIAVPVGLFLVTSAALGALRANIDPPERPVRRRFLSDALDGYRYLARRRELLQVTIGALAINFLSAVAFVVLGLYVRQWLGLGAPIYFGAMLYGSSAGAGVGTLLISRIKFERRAGRFLALFALLQGLMVVLLALSHDFAISLVVFFFYGLFPGMFTIVFLATVQATVPNDRLGRVLAADEVGSYALVPIGQYAGGLLTLATNIQVTYLVAGAGTMFVGGGLAALRRLARLGFEPTTETSPEVPPGAMGTPFEVGNVPETAGAEPA